MSIVVTGASGFIGSSLVHALNLAGHEDLILVDEFETTAKHVNLFGAVYSQKIHRDIFVDWLNENSGEVEFIFHLGARTDTAEFNFRVLDSLNLSYSKQLWEICTAKQIPIVYASSAATYGMGENGFTDAHELVHLLKPLNPYGLSKQLFDLHVLHQKENPPFWCGLKFFNVYGPREQHKGRMASVVYHAYQQITQTGAVKLFKSHHADFADGEQLRDFIDVDDVTQVCIWLYSQYKTGSSHNGIYNLGTGKAQTFDQLAEAVFAALAITPSIEYIDIPTDIRDKYQYYTQADMRKLKSAGYATPFRTLQEAVPSYIHYLRN